MGQIWPVGHGLQVKKDSVYVGVTRKRGQFPGATFWAWQLPMATWEGAGVELWLSLLSWNIFLGGWTISECQIKKHRTTEASESVATIGSALSSLMENKQSSVAAALGALTGLRSLALPLGTVPSDQDCAWFLHPTSSCLPQACFHAASLLLCRISPALCC